MLCCAGGECGIPTHLRYLMPTPAPALAGQYWCAAHPAVLPSIAVVEEIMLSAQCAAALSMMRVPAALVSR